MKKYKIFVINPGSTSTKLALFENEHKILETNVFHDSSVLLQFPTVNAQLPYRKKLIMDFLSENHIDLSDVDAIVGRGGSCYPVASGVYVIDDKLIEDTAAGKGAANWLMRLTTKRYLRAYPHLQGTHHASLKKEEKKAEEKEEKK